MSLSQTLKIIDRLLPQRILGRPSVQILRGRLAARARMRRSDVGPGMPIIGEFTFEKASDWRADLMAAIAALSRRANQANDRAAWIMCLGMPPEAPDDVYAMAIQAERVVQLQMFADPGEYQAFSSRYVPLASMREAKAFSLPTAIEVLTNAKNFSGSLGRSTQVRASMHHFIKQIGGDSYVIVTGARSLQSIPLDVLSEERRDRSVKIMVVGPPPIETQKSELPVFIARHMGFTLLEELAISRTCDGYVGPADHYAIMAADAGLPCLVSDPRASGLANNGNVTFTEDIAADLQIWLRQLP